MDNNFFLQYYSGLNGIVGNPAFEQWRDELPIKIAAALQPAQHGDIPGWWKILQQLPYYPVGKSVLSSKEIEFSSDAVPDMSEQAKLQQLLMQLGPWRKGPYSIHGVVIDSEWRSDLKWNRLQNHIASLENKLVLDVGCGNGYHCWRMAAMGARAVIGIDPTLLYLMQYFAVQHFARNNKVFVLPFPLEMLPANLRSFDTVLSMGVLYHQRSPLDHLLALRSCLQEGGELVLETLVIDDKKTGLLVPQDRYAQMKNVWFIPNADMLQIWLSRCGFKDIRLIDISKTTAEEQRATIWSGEVSLSDFLDPDNADKTIEGYPAPTRAILVARV
ncbi:MAG: tRNA 5-methoxyuridine(34)/uridine 5-oxyacetic acid(34) synthase CmoB [Gammaproteobacteria bacterium]|nr:tRNA 5-methoxyuridine(34)/uridine 5-oxyacetic acid(34) synthase CmoB [Gammaproteobacteria bacterium]